METALWAAFAWIGAAVVSTLATALVGLVVLGIAVLWQAYGPEIICRRPSAINVWSSYRGDVRTGEGKRVKCNEDMQITRLIGIAWRFRWFFGVMIFKKDEE